MRGNTWCTPDSAARLAIPNGQTVTQPRLVRLTALVPGHFGACSEDWQECGAGPAYAIRRDRGGKGLALHDLIAMPSGTDASIRFATADGTAPSEGAVRAVKDSGWERHGFSHLRRGGPRDELVGGQLHVRRRREPRDPHGGQYPDHL